MYVCGRCGNYRSFTVSIPETVTNSLVKTKKGEYEEESLYEKVDELMQDIEDTMVCDECESMGIVDVGAEYLDIKLQKRLYIFLAKKILNKRMMKIMKKEADNVGNAIDVKALEKAGVKERT